MKVSILFIALVLAVAEVKSDFKEEIHKIDMACRAETHVSEDDIKSFLKGETKADAKDALKCHIKCIMEKQGHWKNGAFDAATALKELKNAPNLKDHQDEISKIIDECKDLKGANDCDTAYLITQCVIDHHPGPM